MSTDAPVTFDDATTKPECRNCGASVSKQFTRVFGDNRDIVHRCPECTTNRALDREASNADEYAGDMS